MALPGVRTAGTFGSGTGAVTPNAPTSIATGDLEVLIATTEPGQTVSITTLGGGAWTALPGTPVTQTAAEVLYVWYRIRQAGDGNPVVTPSSDHCTATRLAFTGVDPLTPIVNSAVSSEATSDTSLSFATGISTSYKNCLVVCVATSTVDSNTTQVPSGGGALTNATLTSVALLRAGNTTSGLGGGHNASYGQLAATGSMGTWSGTYASASPKTYCVFEVRPAEAPKSGKGYSKTQGGGGRAGSTLNKTGGAYTAGQASGVKDYTPMPSTDVQYVTGNGAGPSLTVPVATDGYLIVAVAGNNKAVTLTRVRWGAAGPDLALLERFTGVNTNWSVELWGLANPPTGADGAVLTWDGTAPGNAGFTVMLSGAHQTVQNGDKGGADSASGTKTGPSLTVPTGGLQVACMFDGSATTVTNGTMRLDDGGGDGVATLAATGSVVWSGTGQNAIGAVVILPAVSGPQTYERVGSGVSSAQASGTRAASTLGRGGSAYQAGQATGVRARDVAAKLGGAYSALQTSGTHSADTWNRAGKAYTAGQASGVRSRDVARLGGAYSAAQAGATRVGTWNRSGGAYTAGQASGTEQVDSAVKQRSGKAYTALQASGIRGRDAAKLGGAYTAGQAGGARSGSTLNRSGKAYAALQASGARARDQAKTGAAYCAAQAGGTRAGTWNRVGKAYSAAQASATRQRDLPHLGTAYASLRASGVHLTPVRFSRVNHGGYCTSVGGGAAVEGARYAVMCLNGNAGDQSQIPTLKTNNPGLKVFRYVDALVTQTNSPTDTGNLLQYTYCNANHSDWFVLDQVGARVLDGGGAGYYVMDLGNPALQAYAMDQLLALLASEGGWDGVYWDELNARINYFVQGGQVMTTPDYSTHAKWQAAVQSFLAYSTARLRAAGYLVVANVGLQEGDEQVWHDWNQLMDGAFVEGFTCGSNGVLRTYESASWQAQLTNLVDSEANHKLHWARTYRNNEAAHTYGLATLMLASQGYSTWDAEYTMGAYGSAYNCSSGGGPVWLGEYDTAKALGQPLGDYYTVTAGVTLYRRDFQGGSVIVNPHNSDASSYALGGTYTGSGLTNQTSVTLAATSGLILALQGVPAKTGGAYSPLRASGVRGLSANRAASANSKGQASGARGRAVAKQGGAYAAGHAGGARTVTLGKAGAVYSALQASGAESVGHTYQKLGSASSPLVASGGRVATLNRAGGAYTAGQASGVRFTSGVYQKLGGASTTLQAGGARAGTWNRGGSAASALQASATKSRTADRAGSAYTQAQASGLRSRDAAKTGTATSAAWASAARVATLNRTGTAYSTLHATGVHSQMLDHWPLLATTQTVAIPMTTGERLARVVTSDETILGG